MTQPFVPSNWPEINKCLFRPHRCKASLATLTIVDACFSSMRIAGRTTATGVKGRNREQKESEVPQLTTSLIHVTVPSYVIPNVYGLDTALDEACTFV